ncbi:MAG: cytochrome c-type biogenesis protein CcmH [Gammaproteobacteria bacterium]|nr:cytochrome c-type biogenesis protein CcmH [Gammaproteobacteria bacterium]
MRTGLFYLLLIFSLFISNACLAKVELFEFENDQQQQAYQTLSEQLRCLVCQNQNLADSNAELAQDMRNKTYQMVKQNKSEQDIIDYWVSRYGDFVLYDPPFKQITLILWLGPFVLLILAIYIGLRIVRSNKAQEITVNNKDKREEIQKLLDS